MKVDHKYNEKFTIIENLVKICQKWVKGKIVLRSRKIAQKNGWKLNYNIKKKFENHWKLGENLKKMST